MTFKNITEDDIQAFVDNQLDANRKQQIEEYLQHNPADAQRVAEYQKINLALQNEFDAQLDSSLNYTIDKQYSSKAKFKVKSSKNRFNFNLTSIAAGTVLFFLGAVSHWFIQVDNSIPIPMAKNNNIMLATQAVYAHAVYTPEKIHPVEVTAKQQEHLVKWLSKRLDEKINIPNLTSLGFELVGGRLLPAGEQTAAQFMYENAEKQRLTLYLKKNQNLNEMSGFKFYQQDNLNSFYWIDEHFGYVIIGNISKQKLTETAFKVYSATVAGSTT